jgi:exopolysaccharide production protein ExoZ
VALSFTPCASHLPAVPASRGDAGRDRSGHGLPAGCFSSSDADTRARWAPPCVSRPEWTLIYECSYYVALFALALAGMQRYLVPIAYGWLMAIAAAQLIPGWDGMALPLYRWARPAILFKVPSAAFAGGLLVPTLARYAPMDLSVIAVATCLLFWPETLSARYWVVSLVATLIVLDVSRLHVRAPVFATLGDWSYALYLCHLPAFVVALKLAPGPPLVVGLLGALGSAAIFERFDVMALCALGKWTVPPDE